MGSVPATRGESCVVTSLATSGLLSSLVTVTVRPSVLRATRPSRSRSKVRGSSPWTLSAKGEPTVRPGERPLRRVRRSQASFRKRTVPSRSRRTAASVFAESPRIVAVKSLERGLVARAAMQP